MRILVVVMVPVRRTVVGMEAIAAAVPAANTEAFTRNEYFCQTVFLNYIFTISFCLLHHQTEILSVFQAHFEPISSPRLPAHVKLFHYELVACLPSRLEEKIKEHFRGYIFPTVVFPFCEE